MDVDAVEAASKQLKTRAADVQALVTSIDKLVHSLPGIWEGPDARTFVNDWWPQHKKALLTASENIKGLGQSAWNNAQEQRQVGTR
jgi:uncharacterized protein YukE